MLSYPFANFKAIFLLFFKILCFFGGGMYTLIFIGFFFLILWGGMHTQAQVARRPEEGIGVPASGLHVVVSHPTWASVTVD